MTHALLTVAAWCVIAAFAAVVIGVARSMADSWAHFVRLAIYALLTCLGLALLAWTLSFVTDAHADPLPIRDLAAASVPTHSFSFTAPRFSADLAAPCSLATTFPAGCVQARIIRARQSQTWQRYKDAVFTFNLWPVVRREALPETTYVPVADGQVVTLTYSDSAFVTVATRDSAGNWACPSPVRWR